MPERLFLFLHGYTGSGSEHWQSWLARRLRAGGERVAYPTLPEPDRPRLSDWLTALDGELAAAREPLLIVLAHSCGCALWLHHAVRRPQVVADRVLLVSPPGPRWRERDVVGFMPMPLDRHAVAAAARSTRLVSSTNDPLCAVAEARAYANALTVALDLIPDGDHLHTAAGYGPWPAVEEWALAGRVPLRGR